ncbi:MAG: alpha/beta hydrolase [Clostridia bacterium]|nr:alpha/beta hydrolase [Clostridia bacterium]
MKREEFVISSDFDGLKLYGTIFEPLGKKKGIFQIVHGMGEKRERYFDLASFLCQNVYVVAIHDQRGHGDSVESAEKRGWFGADKKGVAIVEDAVQVTKFLKEKYPALPVCLFGHSMGSMVVRCYIQKHDDLIDKLIVCGSPSNNPLSGIAVFLAKGISLFKGEMHRSKTLAYLSTGKGNENFPGEGPGCWLSKNRENIDAFYGDEKCNFTFTCNGFENLFSLMKNTYTKGKYKVKNPELPIHFTSGSDDAVLGNEDKWLKAQNMLRKVGYKNVSGKLYHGLRHEIHNEPEREEVYRDFLEFLQK